MQLLQITTTPIKYELQITNAKLQYQHDWTPTAKVETAPAKLTMQKKNITANIDTYQARKSLGFATITDRIAEAARKGQESLAKVIREKVLMGAEFAKIEDHVSIGQVISRKMLEQPSLYTAFLPSCSAEISWSPNQSEMRYEPSKTQYDWQIRPIDAKYIPGQIEMKILQRPDVQIEYVGGPIYIPKSADSNYQSDEE